MSVLAKNVSQAVSCRDCIVRILASLFLLLFLVSSLHCLRI